MRWQTTNTEMECLFQSKGMVGVVSKNHQAKSVSTWVLKIA